jgi:hypothetical protein
MEPGAMIVSFAAADEAPMAALFAEEWDAERHCDEEPPDDASSNGDPHLVTFDGLTYDVMTLGEFVVARDPAGGFELQTRHEPFGFGAGTSAVAVSDGTTRVTFTSSLSAADPPTIRVDGVVESRPSFAAGSLRVEREGAGEAAEVVWPDGTTVRLEWYLGWFVHVVTPAERARRMEGLLGSADGDLRNDLRTPDGVDVDSAEAEAYESSFALAWAVDDSTSLFDYEPGQSVDTFRIDHPLPDAPIAIDEAAEDRCRAALGPTAAAHHVESCAYDVTATGDDGFVAEYAAVVEDRASPPELATPTPVIELTTAPPASVVAVQPGAGTPALQLEIGESGTVDAPAGAVAVLRLGDCGEDAFVDVLVWRADDPDLEARAGLCDAQGLGAVGLDADDEWIDGEAYVWLPGDGAYTFGVDRVLGDTGGLGPVEVYLDAEPVVLEAADLAEGVELTLDAFGDTAVLLPDPADEFATTGLDRACAVEVYWNETFPALEPRTLRACEHTSEIDFPPTDHVMPIVAFNRTDGAVEVAVTPG